MNRIVCLQTFSLPQTGTNNLPVDEFVETLAALVAPTDEKGKQNRIVQFSSRYRLAFSLLNEDASAGNAVMAWNVQKGIQGVSGVESVAYTS